MQLVCVIKPILIGAVVEYKEKEKKLLNQKKSRLIRFLRNNLFFPGHATLCDVQDVIDLICLIALEEETYYGLAALLIGSSYKTLLNQ